MNILIAPDSFKNCLKAKEVAEHISVGINRVFAEANVKCIPLADGGEGTVESLIFATNGKIITCSVLDPLSRPIKAQYGIFGQEPTAIIEMAAASGIELLKETEKNPLYTNTIGTGQLILDAINKGCTKIIIGIGGSATNDGGMGMAYALGYNFYDKSNKLLKPNGQNLHEIHSIGLPKQNLIEENNIEIVVASDVENPLLGKFGASNIFAPQKGASSKEIKILEKGLTNFRDIVSKTFSEDFSLNAGAGAAGGLGFGLMHFTKAQIKPGFEIISTLIDLEKEINWADIIITAEGKTDSQTAFGKLPFSIGQMAYKKNKRTIVICGWKEYYSEELPEYIQAVIPIINKPSNIDFAIANAQENLIETAESIGRLIQLGMILERNKA
ncbi:MAG: glycerate kinase [Bacteroidales bacterium]